MTEVPELNTNAAQEEWKTFEGFTDELARKQLENDKKSYAVIMKVVTDIFSKYGGDIETDQIIRHMRKTYVTSLLNIHHDLFSSDLCKWEELLLADKKKGRINLFFYFSSTKIDHSFDWQSIITLNTFHMSLQPEIKIVLSPNGKEESQLREKNIGGV
jgi:hypothetical protein